MSQISHKEPTDLTDQEWLKVGNYFSALNLIEELGDLKLDNYSESYTESFESGFGSWVNVAGNTSNWIRKSGSTGSSSTGPSSAYDGSYYIYVETSSGDSYDTGDTDIIEYDIGETADGSIDFYYHQYGDDQGVLYLEGWDGSSWNVIWSKNSNSNAWYNVNKSFSGYSKLRFRNTRASGSYHGDVALDLINVTIAGVSGTRISNPLALSGNATSSNIKWSSTTPTNTAVKIYTAITTSNTVEPTTWTEATHDSSIADATGDLTGKYLWLKQELTTTDDAVTPSLSWVEINIASGTLIKRWNGTAWVEHNLKRYNGTDWEDTTIKRWNGTSWDEL